MELSLEVSMEKCFIHFENISNRWNWLVHLEERSKLNNNYFKYAMALIFAGAIGNLFDSLFYGMIFDSGLTWNAELGMWKVMQEFLKLTSLAMRVFYKDA